MQQSDGSYNGIGIDLWRRVADRLQLRYRFVEQPDIAALIKGIAEGSYDASFGALSVTADRAKLVDFTQPFFATGLGIAVPVGERKLFSVSRILLSEDFLQAVLILIGITLAIGFVVWLFEHRQTHHFQGGIKGLASGFWWSAVAMTSSGGRHGCAGDASWPTGRHLLDDRIHHCHLGLLGQHYLEADERRIAGDNPRPGRSSNSSG